MRQRLSASNRLGLIRQKRHPLLNSPRPNSGHSHFLQHRSHRAQTSPSLHCCAMATLAQRQNFANAAPCAKQSLGRNAASLTLASNIPFAPPPNIFPNVFPRHRTLASHSARFLQNSKSRLGGARVVHGVCTLFTPPESRDFQILTPVLRARLTHGFACLQARSAPNFPP